MLSALEASGAELVTVALRRLDLDDPAKKTILDVIDWTRYRVLPNTAGCQTAEEAIRIARLARSMGLSDWVKLEVIPDPRYLLPDPVETLRAAEVLVKEGFTVLPYINADPILARRLEAVGCATVMPLGSPIGSGQGLVTQRQIELIIEAATVPVVVDAGLRARVKGATVLQLRDPGASVRTLEREARRLIPTATVPVIISSRIDVALATKAYGVHLPERDVSVADARKLFSKGLLGRSV